VRSRCRRIVRLALIALPIACILAISSVAVASVHLDASMRSRHFITYYNSAHRLQAELLSDVAEDELARVSANLGYTPDPDHPFPLKIYNSRSAFVSQEGIEGLKMTVGTTQAISETIAIDASGLFVLPRQVISHEITHAVLFRMLGPTIVDLPLWFNEGLAQHESGAYGGASDEQVANAAGDGTLLPLSSLSGAFPREQIDLAYAESSSAVRYLIDKHGPTSPRVLVEALARTGSIDKAMLVAAHMDGGAFDDAWYAHTTARFWGIRMARVVMAIFSAIMAVLAVAAFIVRRRRMAEAARKWEEEQFEKALRRQQGNDWSY